MFHNSSLAKNKKSMKVWDKKIGVLPALLVAVLSFGGFMGMAAIVSQNNPSLVPVSLAKDGEDDGGDDNEDEDKDEDKDESEDEDNDNDEDKDDDGQSESEKRAAEAAKKRAEQEREAVKKAAEQDDDNDVKEEENEVEDETEDDSKDGLSEDESDDNGMYRDRDQTLSKLTEEVDKAEKEILEKQAEGVDATAALARLALAKAALTSVGSAFDASDLEKAKDLSKEVRKLAQFASEKDLHDAKEVAEDVAKVSKRITQTYGKIVLLEAVGGDGSTFRSSLASLEAELTTLKATIASGGYDSETMSETLEALERRVKRIKSSAESAIYALGGTDSQFDDDYENEADDVAEHLKDVADIEDDSVGEAIRQIAEDHKDAARKVGESVSDVDKRNPVLQTLFGASESDLSDLESQITANKARSEALLQAAQSIEDQDVKAIILEQVAVLQEQTSKLEVFVNGQRDRLSAFGWFFNLF